MAGKPRDDIVTIIMILTHPGVDALAITYLRKVFKKLYHKFTTIQNKEFKNNSPSYLLTSA